MDKYEQWVYSIPNWIREIEYFDALKKAILEILSGIMDAIKSVKGKKSDILSGKCLEHIEEHFTEDISLETIAEEFHFNPSYFSFLFKSKTGINFSQYLLDIRLKKGKELLGKTDKKVYEIAHMVGYKDPKYFNRVFKKAFGITPDEYRRI